VNCLYPRWSKRNRIIFAILIVFSITVLTLYFRESSNGILHRVQRYTVNMVVPLQSGVSRAISPFRSAFRFVAGIGSMNSENRALKKENKKLKADVVTLRMAEKENKRLKKLLGFKDKTDLVLMPAHVIGKSSTAWQDVVVLDKGREDGIKKNMPVVVDSGLVGQVIDASPSACRVQLITDQKSGVGAQIVSTGETGVVQGQIGGELKLSFISKGSEVKRGDQIVTSGLGGIFPKGIYIGVVKKVIQRPYGLFKEIEIESAVGFHRLEEALIITNPVPKNPYGTEDK